jgi:hypothetical protein
VRGDFANRCAHTGVGEHPRCHHPHTGGLGPITGQAQRRRPVALGIKSAVAAFCQRGDNARMAGPNSGTGSCGLTSISEDAGAVSGIVLIAAKG